MLKVPEGYIKYRAEAYSGLKHTNILQVMGMAPYYMCI